MGVKGAFRSTPRRMLPVGIHRTKYGGRCAILYGATLQPGHLLHAPPSPPISRFGPATHRHEYSLFDDISRAPSYSYVQGDFPVRGESLIRNNDQQTLHWMCTKYEVSISIFLITP